MSKTRSEPQHYQCSCDCVQSGCPGHTLVIVECMSSDTVTIEVDGKIRDVFDDNLFAAILKAAGVKLPIRQEPV